MARYIDADKLKYSLELSIKSWGRDCNSRAPIIKTTYQDVLNRLEAMQTADVVEVRHGKWNTVCNASLTGGLNWYMHSCSGCYYSYKTVVPIGYEYCPKCGAKMDGKRSENGQEL